MIWVMIHRLVGNVQRAAARERLTAPQIAGKPRVGAAGNLQPEALSLAEVIGSRPQLNPNLARAVTFAGWLAGAETQYAVAEIGGSARSRHHAEPGKEIGILEARRDVQLGGHRADDFYIVGQDWAGVDEHITAGPETAGILFPHPLTGSPRNAPHPPGGGGARAGGMVGGRCGGGGEGEDTAGRGD